jgi:hypothetical protein
MLDERMMFALRAVDESRRLHRNGRVDNHERYARATGYRLPACTCTASASKVLHKYRAINAQLVAMEPADVSGISCAEAG